MRYEMNFVQVILMKVLITMEKRYHMSLFLSSVKVIIGNNAWIGMNVICLGGVHVVEGSVVQAGSVVVRYVEPLSIAGGSPAEKFSMRNKTHYLDC